MVARCAGGCPESGEEEEVSLELVEVLFYHQEGKKLLARLYLLCFCLTGTLDHLLVQAVVIYWMMLGGMPLVYWSCMLSWNWD